MDGKTVSDTALQAGDHTISYSEIEKKIFRPIFPTAKSISNLFRYKEKDSLHTSFHNK